MKPLKNSIILTLILLAAPLLIICQTHEQWLDIGQRQMEEDQLDSSKISFSKAYSSDDIDHKILAIRGQLKTGLYANTMSIGDSLINLGDSLCQLQKFNKEVFIFQLSKAEFYKKGSQYKKALAIYKDFMPKAKRLLDIDYEYASGLQHYGLIYEGFSQYDSCVYYIEKARDIYIAKEDTLSLSYALLCNNLGTAYLRMSDLAKSKAVLEKALKILLELPNSAQSDIGMVRGNIGVILSREGKYEESNAMTEAAIASNKLIKDYDGMAYNYYSLGVNNYYIGDYGRARSYLEECIRIRKDIYGEWHSSLIGAYEVIAIALGESGDYFGSMKNYKHARKIIKYNFKEPVDMEGYNLENIANTFKNMGQQDSALVYIKMANEILEKILPSISHHKAIHYFSLGNIYASNNQLTQGQEWMEKALDIHDQLELEDDFTAASIKVNIAQIQAKNLNWKLADDNFNEALTIVGLDENMDINSYQANPSTLKIFNFYLSYLYNKYIVFDDIKYLDKYQKFSELYLIISEKLRRQFNDPYTKSTLIKNTVPVFRTQIGVYSNLYLNTKKREYLDILFEQAEYSRATMIRDMQDEKIASYARVDKEIIKEEKRLKTSLSEANANYFQYPDSVNIQSQLFTAKEDLNQFISNISKDNPNYFALKFGSKSPTILEVQKKLKPKEILIEYMIDDTSYYALTITTDNSNLHFLGARDEIDNSINIYRNQITENKSLDADNSKNIFSNIWESIPELKTYQRVILCPTSSLHYLNFETLKNHTTDRYLIEDYNISYTLSAYIYLNTDHIKKKNQNFAIAIAPGFEDEIKNQYKNALKTMDNIDEDYIQTVRQPWSVKLAEKLKSEYRNKAHIGIDAPESKVKSALSQGNIIYFGTHAITNEHEPLRSKLVLTKELGDQKEDGYLHAYEIYGLELAADLTVLSACESGIGQIEEGEGMISLAHSIHYAGCPSTVLSLWKVDEKSNTALIDAFLEKIADGQIKSEALRNAKLDYLSKNKGIHPYFWGGMILMGQDGSIELVKKNQSYLWYLTPIIVLILAFLVLFRNKKK